MYELSLLLATGVGLFGAALIVTVADRASRRQMLEALSTRRRLERLIRTDRR